MSPASDPSFSKVLTTKGKLADFLGSQRDLLDKPIYLIEVFAGHAALSKSCEEQGKYAIRIGLKYGHDLTIPEHRALVCELAKYTQPHHVHVSWECTSVAGFSQLNYSQYPQNQQAMDERRRMVGHWLNLYGDLHMIQHLAGRFCHGENPERSMAWLHPRFLTLPGLLWCVTDQCPYGLRSIRPPHRLLQKSTGICTNSVDVQKYFPKRCPGNHEHDVIAGNYRGVNISKAAENYPKPFARSLMRCFLKSTEHSAYAGLDDLPTSASNHKHVLQYLRQLHVALGHASKASMAQVLREAGANDWLVKAAGEFECILCSAQKGQKPIPKVGLKLSNAINDCVYLDFFFVRLKKRGNKQKACIMSLYDEATGLTQYHHINDKEPTSALAINALEMSWIPIFGAPKRLYTDDDRVFTSKEFARFCRRYGVHLDLTASYSGHQHGSIEQLHQHARVSIKSAWQELDDGIPLQSLCNELAAARNDMAKHHGVSPNMLAFGQQRRDPPHFSGGLAPLADTLLREDEYFQRLTAVRQAARTAYIKADATARLARAAQYQSRPSKGFVPGERVLVYRRKPLGSTRAHEPEIGPKKGFWYGPAVVLATDSSSDPEKLRPRLYYIAMFGRLYRVAEHQLKSLPPTAELARRRLEEFQRNGAVLVGNGNVSALRPDTQLKGIDITEDPSPQDEGDDQDSDSEDEDMPSAPPVPQGPPQSYGPPPPEVPQPSPPEEPKPSHEVVQSVQRPKTPLTARKKLLEDFPVAALRQHPAQASQRMRSRSPPRMLPGVEPSGGSSSSTARPADQSPPRRDVDMSPPLQATPRRVREETTEPESRPRAKQRAISVPASIPVPDDGELTEDEFSHLADAFFSTEDHSYGKNALEITIDFDTWEILSDDFNIQTVLKDAFATSQTAKRKIEVTERFLTSDEKLQFRKAKVKEWNSFVENKVVELASRLGVDAKRIIGSRWVLTWKKVDGGKTAKARLVLLGYQDPDLGAYARSSPTLTRLGRHSVLQIAAQEGWNLFSLDAKNAFLAGELSSRSKALYMSVPRDLLEMLKLPQDTVFKLLKSAYGLAEAPIAWFRYLKKQLVALGWVQHPLDECVFRLYDGAKLAGIIGLHVDDLLVAGYGKHFDKVMSHLESKLPFGERKYGRFVYCGLQIEQVNKNLITVDQFDYIDKLQPMAHKHLAVDKPIPASEQTNYKGLCGGLGWAVINTRLDYAFDVSYLASKGLNATGADVALGNKIMRAMKTHKVQLRFFKVGPSMADWVTVTFHDAGWATRPSLHSQAGGAIFAAEASVRNGDKPVKAVLLDWVCAKIERVVRSSFEAEINSAQIALDHMEYVNAFLAMCAAPIDAAQYRAMKRSKRSVLIGDNKGLFTAVESANPITTKGEKRLTIDKVIMKDHLIANCVDYYWTNSGHQLADGFTKLSSGGGRTDLLLQAISEGVIRIVYSEVSGRKEAKENQYECHNAEGNNLFRLDEEDEPEEQPQQPHPVDGWDKFYYDVS